MSADHRAVRAAARRAAAAIGADALLILCALDDHDDGITGEVYVGIPTLARLTGYGLDRVRARLAAMVRAGVLTDTGRRVRSVTVYRLPWGADVTPEAIANPRPSLDQPSGNPRPTLDQLSGTPRVLSTGTQGFRAHEGEGEAEGEGDPRPERCARPDCPNHGDFTGPATCHGCRDARARQDSRDQRAAADLDAARRAAHMQDHPCEPDAAGLSCTRCGLPPQRHPNPHPTGTLAPVGIPAEVTA